MAVRSILIVDDHREVRRLIRLALEGRQNGYRILDVPSGEEALLINASQPVDVLLADVRLAGMSGIELARKMRERRPDMRIILISGIPRDEIQEQIEQLKADGFYSKPIDLSKLAEDVDRLVDRGSAPPEPVRTAAAAAPGPAVQPSPVGKTETPGRQAALDLLLQQFGAASLLLLNRQGQLIAQAGSRGNASLPPAVQAQLEAFTRFASLLGAEANEDVVRLWGRSFLLCLVRRAELALIAFFFDTGSDEQRLDLSRQFAAAARDAWSSLAQTAPLPPAPVEPASRSQPLPVPAQEEVKALPDPVPAPAEDAPDDIAELFLNGTDTGLDTGELNNFWENAAEDIDDVSANASAISYDQALNLGLAPEE